MSNAEQGWTVVSVPLILPNYVAREWEVIGYGEPRNGEAIWTDGQIVEHSRGLSFEYPLLRRKETKDVG